MKTLTKISLALLCLVFACETESVSENQSQQAFYVYDTSEQFTTTETFIIDFEEFNAGDIVTDITIEDPFEDAQVVGLTMAFPDENAAMVFDSSNPTGNDFDIGTPNELYGGPGVGDGGESNDIALGNVLILSEDLDATDPDDIFEVGASFIFDFSANDNVTLNDFDILDIESSSNPTRVILYDLNDNILLSKEIIPGGDNSKTNVDLEKTSGVAFMEIIMNSSGAIDNISFDLETEVPCVDCDSNIVELSFINTNSAEQTAIRFETPEGEVVYDGILQTNEEFTISGTNIDGSFGSELILFVNDESRATLLTDCSQAIGPGFFLPSLLISSGTTLSGGQLCPVEIFIG